MFFYYEAFFGGEPDPEELAKLYRRSDKPLYQEITLPDGTVKKLWCSFSAEQIDLDTNHPMTREYIMNSLKFLGTKGISVVRMDAYGYITKVRDTNCFFIEPQVWVLIRSMEDLLEQQDMTLLSEVHDRYETALKISKQGYYTYDFVLPLLTLHTILNKTTHQLKHWLSICPRNQFTVLDTHDGIDVFDAEGHVSREEEERILERVEPNLSYSYKPTDMSRRKHWRSYQLYCTYYSVMEENDAAYALARAIQLFAPGIPQVYYVGLLAGCSDLSFDPADHRFINRHNYTVEEVEQEVQRPIVQKILSMLRLRNTHPAFDGELEIGDTADDKLLFTRRVGEEVVSLEADLQDYSMTIRYTENGDVKVL